MKYLIILIIIVSFSFSCSSTVKYSARSGKKYKQVEPAGSEIIGYASYYGKKFHGRKTANGEIFDMYGKTAAHRSFRFGTVLRVTNLDNDKSVVVKVNDRGPFVAGRILDLSYGAAKELDMIASGVAKVRIKILKLGDNE